MCRVLASCVYCGNDFRTEEMEKTSLVSRGNRVAYVCQRCATMRKSYYDTNDLHKGKGNILGSTYGFEWESSYASVDARAELFQYGYLPTSDSSIGDTEFISPLYHGLNSCKKLFATWEKLVQSGDLQADSHCGHHIHVGIASLNGNNMDYIRRYYQSLFTPLSKHMLLSQNYDKVVALFGRYFNSYADSIHDNRNAMDRYNFINITKHSGYSTVLSNHFEFRLSKFNTAKQYLNLVHFCTDVTTCVYNNFVAHFNDMNHLDKDKRQEYRLHKADVTSKKLIKLFDKYTA